MRGRICKRSGCGKPAAEKKSGPGRPPLYCSARCRKLHRSAEKAALRPARSMCTVCEIKRVVAPFNLSCSEACSREIDRRRWRRVKYRTMVEPKQRLNLGRRGTAAERFAIKYRVDGVSGCWVWMGALSGGQMGYGQFYDGKTNARAHRWSYENFVGPIPAGMTLDHLCGRTECVNPHHLEPVTSRENSLRYRERKAAAGDVRIRASAPAC